MIPCNMRPASPEIRAEALRLVPLIGVTAAAQQVGVSPSTVSRWGATAGISTDRAEQTAAATRAAALAWDVRRAAMADRIGDVAEKALSTTEEAIDNGKVRDAKDAATTMAILVDKAQLLTGSATSRFGSEAERKHAISEAKQRALRLVG